MLPLVCLYEDRTTHIVAVQLLVMSLQKHHPELEIRLRFPSPPPFFAEWCNLISKVTLVTDSLDGAGSYNIKPHMLLDGLNTGASSCIWLDTDIIVCGKISWLDSVPDGTLVSTLDPYKYPFGSNYRCQAFGLDAQDADFPGAINSAVVLVFQTHKQLLLDWAILLKSPQYIQAQNQPVATRNPMMLGDQDALSALVASKKYTGLAHTLLEHPRQILHNQGVSAFSFIQRIKMKRMKNLPPLVHAMASIKPWMMKDIQSPFHHIRQYYDRTFLETSPYLCAAREYQHLIYSDISWLKIQSIYSKLMLTIFRGNPIGAGALQSLFHQILK